MKMEVLLVQNQFKKEEFGNKEFRIQDWDRSLTPPNSTEYDHIFSRLSNSSIVEPEKEAIESLSHQLQKELKDAKSKHLDCSEVLLPCDLLHRVARDMLVMSEKEPCGIRGCTIFIEFQEEPNSVRRIANFKCDPNTVSTFELYITLVQNRSSWSSILPQFLKNLARGSTIVISADYKLCKNKLYDSFAE